MKMDLNAIIENMETGDQDAALMALQTYNKEKSQCFIFDADEEADREDGEEVQSPTERLGELVLGFLERDLQPSCQMACLETIRILSRDKNSLAPFITRDALSTLAHHAGIAPDNDEGSGEAPENPDLDRIVEALKCICNIVLHNKTAQVVSQDLGLMTGLAERLRQCHDDQWNHEVRFFDLRLTFLLTATRMDVRSQLAHELHGVSLLGNALDATLGLSWPDTFEVARTGVEEGATELPPLSREQVERAMEILKILFNITFDCTRRKVDEEEAAGYRHLAALLRHCLMSTADGEERTDEFHSHVVNLMGNLPLPCLDVLLTPKVHQGSIEYMGVNMDAVSTLLNFMEKRLDRGVTETESLIPSLNLLTESARIHRETRKYLRMQVLPPLRDVKNRPEVGDTLRNKLVRLMTNIDTDVKNCASEFLFVLCKESVARYIKYTGYGNAAGLLAARGLLRGGKDPGNYSDDEDSDTEEYREFRNQINPVTGIVEAEQPNPMEGMTDEQKELEAMKLINMFDRLSRSHVIQPMQLGTDGKMTAYSPGGVNQAHASDSEEDEADEVNEVD